MNTMKSRILFIILLVISFSSFSEISTYAKEINEVILVAQDIMQKNNHSLNDYKLVEAKNLVISGGDYKGKEFWKVTYLLKDIIGRGKGGEIYIEVNYSHKTGKVLGYGE